MNHTEYQYVVMPGSTDELILVNVDMETGEYIEKFDVVIPDMDVCFAVVPGDEEDGTRASILRHGSRESVIRYIEKSNKKIDIANSMPPVTEMMDLPSADESLDIPPVTLPHLRFESAKENGWSLEDINKIITTTNYIDMLIREKDAILVENKSKENNQ